MTAVATCPICGEAEEAGLPSLLREHANAIYKRDGSRTTFSPGGMDSFCSKFGVAFDSREVKPPRPFRLGPQGWEWLEMPKTSVGDSVRGLYGELKGHRSVVATYVQLWSVLPEGISPYRWWDGVSTIRELRSTSSVLAAQATRDGSSALISVLVAGSLPDVLPLPEGIVLHVLSWLDPIGVVVFAQGRGLRILRPEPPSLDDGLNAWSPLPGPPETVTNRNMSELLDYLEAIFPRSASILNGASWAPPAGPTVKVVWGHSRSGAAYVALEQRASLLSRTWRALQVHETWDDVEASESEDVVSWLTSEMEKTMDISDVESLFGYTLFELSRDRLQDYDQESWPWLNSADEFDHEFESELPPHLREVVTDAFASGEIGRGVSMTTGDLILIRSLEAFLQRLTDAGASCRRDDDLIQDAVGPYQ